MGVNGKWSRISLALFQSANSSKHFITLHSIHTCPQLIAPLWLPTALHSRQHGSGPLLLWLLSKSWPNFTFLLDQKVMQVVCESPRNASWSHPGEFSDWQHSLLLLKNRSYMFHRMWFSVTLKCVSLHACVLVCACDKRNGNPLTGKKNSKTIIDWN